MSAIFIPEQGANATIQQRLTVVRIFYDYLIDEGIRQNKRNPVGKGK